MVDRTPEIATLLRQKPAAEGPIPRWRPNIEEHLSYPKNCPLLLCLAFAGLVALRGHRPADLICVRGHEPIVDCRRRFGWFARVVEAGSKRKRRRKK
jgi:hypothetical protein